MAVRKIIGIQGGLKKTVLRVTDDVPTNGQILVYNSAGTAYAPADADGGSIRKSGKVLKASFSGTPQKYVLTFGTAMADATYIITLTTEGDGVGSYVLGAESILSTGFTINCGTNNIDNLVAVHWTVESASNP